jgi:hypothetical protein
MKKFLVLMMAVVSILLGGCAAPSGYGMSGGVPVYRPQVQQQVYQQPMLQQQPVYQQQQQGTYGVPPPMIMSAPQQPLMYGQQYGSSQVIGQPVYRPVQPAPQYSSPQFLGSAMPTIILNLNINRRRH